MLTIGLYKSKTTISKLIQWQTRGEYSHAAIHLDDGFAIEAWHKGGVQHHPIGSLHPRGTKVAIFTIESFYFPDLTQAYAMDQVGKKYDFTMVARFMSRRGETRRSKDKLFCSELVFDALVYGGLPLFENTLGWEVSPDLIKRSPHIKYQRTITIGE